MVNSTKKDEKIDSPTNILDYDWALNLVQNPKKTLIFI